MMTGIGQTINLLSLTDCIYFTNSTCMFNGKCHYRHCQAAIKQLEKCPNWPDSCRNISCPYRHMGMSSKQSKPLPENKNLISLFWDIENVPVPKGQKPFDIVQRIRQKLVREPGLQEVDFSCYCDSTTISEENQRSLSHATVRIVHVPDRKVNAVDRQIMLDLDRFERVHRPPATVVLISGDIDFIGKLSDLRHQARFHVIVIHNKPAKEELKATVNEHYPWEFFIETSEQQQQLCQPVLINTPGRSRNERANLRPVLKEQLNCKNNITLPMSPKLKQPRVTPTLDLTNNENNRLQNNTLRSRSTRPHQRRGSRTRISRVRDHSEPRKPPTSQSVQQPSTSNTGGNTLPSVGKPVVVPHARIRRAIDMNQLNQQTSSLSTSCEQIPLTENSEATKAQQKSLPCPFCTNEFSTIKALRQHQTDKKHLFDCPNCKEGFPTSNGLKQHQIVKGHNVTNDKDNSYNVQLVGTVDHLYQNQLATRFEHTLTMSNGNTRLVASQNPLANDCSLNRKINDVNYVSNDED